MPKLRIPKEDKPSILAISKLNEGTIQKLSDLIKHTASVSEAGTTRSLLSPLLADLNIEKHEEIAGVISTLYRVKAMREVPTDEFVDDICNGMELKEPEYSKLKNNLQALLGIEEVTLVSKAWNLQTENERLFCQARIITDLRPVFGPDINQGPKAMVITHALKLGFHRNSTEDSHEDIYVSLDADVLNALQEIIERAKAKAKILKSTISNFPYMGRP